MKERGKKEREREKKEGEKTHSNINTKFLQRYCHRFNTTLFFLPTVFLTDMFGTGLCHDHLFLFDLYK